VDAAESADSLRHPDYYLGCVECNCRHDALDHKMAVSRRRTWGSALDA
jgi:hypothetical protein